MSTHSFSVEEEGLVGQLTHDAIDLLQQLIATPSFSREEQNTAALLQRTIESYGFTPQRWGNNVVVRSRHFQPEKQTLLLNSHHDTVRPNAGYKRSPFQPAIEGGKLFGLGSNDAGGCLVSLLAAFRFFEAMEDAAYNLVFAATAEEEISGSGGIESILPKLGKVAGAIVGEPTGMEMAVAERGLLVLDCEVMGVSGHAAGSDGVNAIHKALPDLAWFGNYHFPKASPMLGECKMSVTIIHAGTQHNVTPASCSFTVDIRMNECYTHEEILEIIRSLVGCQVHPRSQRLRATCMAEDHPLVQAGRRLGKESYGSATLSDKALMPFPALKMGPGQTSRSHAADEFIYLSEIENGIRDYILLLKQVL